MKIINLRTNQNFISYGLAFKEMRDLKQVVGLFGINGSGKSRLLRLVPGAIDENKREIGHTKHFIESRRKDPKVGQGKISEVESIPDLKLKLKSLEEDIDLGEDYQIIVINPRGSTIQDQTNMQDVEYREGTSSLLTNPEYLTVKQNCAKFIKSLFASAMAKDFHDNVKGKKYYKHQFELQEDNVKVLKALKEIIKEIMNKDIDFYTDQFLTPIVTLNDRALDPGELSDGERELLAFCTFIVLQTRSSIVDNDSLQSVSINHSLKNKIVLLDEPDLFLHPHAQIKLIRGLRNLIGDKGQLWIATHSLTILSELERDEIWLMDRGDVTSPSIETPGKVLDSLVGEENVIGLENFISSKYEWAAIQFALECLLPPQVIKHNEKDPQQEQVVNQLSLSNKAIKILDFGAGKGRIAQELLRNQKVTKNIYYQSLEINKKHFDVLESLTKELQALSSVLPKKEREIIDNYEKLKETQYQGFFDVILLVNVLHEIPVTKWHKILPTLFDSLQDNGKIIILEDQAIPKGENANEYGYIILDADEFKLLFSLTNKPKSFMHKNPKYSNRLTCIEIPKRNSSVSIPTIKQALERKKTNCKNLIYELRNRKNKRATEGRKNSFLTQLYANVDMALNDL